jgi:hypothetical protein
MGTKFDEMKVAFVIDDLLVRDTAIELFEVLLGLFPNSTIYTFAHKEGAILGPVEQRRIVSTYLSQKIEKVEDWKKYQFLISNAKEQIVVPCNYELCIKFSRGLSHVVPVCEGVPVFTYYFDRTRLDLPKTLLRQKFFHAMVKHLAQMAAVQGANNYFASQAIKETYTSSGEDDIVFPGVNRAEFKPFPEELIASMGGRTLTLIDTTDIEKSALLPALVQKLKANGHDFYFVGPFEYEEVLRNLGVEENRFMRNKCAGELAPLMHRARVLLSLATESFPEVVLMARASHTPVLMIGENTSYSDLLELAKVKKAPLDEAVVIQDFPKEDLESGVADKEVWKKEIFQKINKTLVKFKKEKS